MLDILIPVYNCEKYIEECLTSIKVQTFENYKVRIIDDGSTDKTLEIINKIVKGDDRFIVKTRKNKGVSITRQELLDSSTADDIMFLDSDDYLIDVGYLESMYDIHEMTKADITMSKISYQRGDTPCVKEGCYKHITYNKKEALSDLLYIQYNGSTFNGRIFKRKLFDLIKFPAGKIYEDTAVLYKVFMKAEKVVYYDFAGYVYRIRDNSIMRTQMSKRNMVLLDFSKEILDEVTLNYPELRPAALYTYVNNCMELLRLKVLSPKKFNDNGLIRRELKAYKKEYLSDDNISKVKRLQINIATFSEALFKLMVYGHDVILKKQ